MPSVLKVLQDQLPIINIQPQFKIKQKQLSMRDIADDYLGSGIANDALFDLGFARRFNYSDFGLMGKLGLPRPDVVHSSVYLQPIHSHSLTPSEAPILIGRLPPYFQKVGHVEKKLYKTEMSNEAHYWFLSWRPFDVVMSSIESRIIVFGSELKRALIKTNAVICSGQLGDMIHSNCYTATMHTFAQLACIVAMREVSTVRDRLKAEATIRGLLGLINHYADNHFGIGVANNYCLLRSISLAIAFIKNQGFSHLFNNKQELIYRARLYV